MLEDMSTPHQQARQLLPRMPEEVFAIWFDERITENGWPPFSRVWTGTLRHRSFAEWQQFTWRKQEVAFDLALFNADARNIVTGLIDANVFGRTNIYTMELPHTRESFTHAYTQLNARGRFDEPVILISTDNVFDIADGCHRIAAYVAVQRGFLESVTAVHDEQTTWVGSIETAGRSGTLRT